MAQVSNLQLRALDQRSFVRIVDREFCPGYDLSGLKFLRNIAGSERNLRELYRDRAPFELLQNADDAGAGHAVFILTGDGLAFAHTGRWFSVDNFCNLSDGWSDKNPRDCIGHKGLGFRSVLDITPAPHLIRMARGDVFSIKFGWAANHAHILAILQQHPDLRSRWESWTRNGRPGCPVMAIPGLISKSELGTAAELLQALASGDYGQHRPSFSTLFWFPVADLEIHGDTLAALGPTPITANQASQARMVRFLHDLSVFLPFLNSLLSVRVYVGQDLLGSVELLGAAPSRRQGMVTVRRRDGGEEHDASFFQMRFSHHIPDEIRLQPDTPKLLQELREATIALSVALKDGEPVPQDQACFHVYFPTEEMTGLGYVVQGDFYVAPDRKRLMDGRYNEWLLDCAAHAAANDFLTGLLRRYRPRPVFAALAPTGQVPTSRSAHLIDALGKGLRERLTPFIPSAAGPLLASEVALPPRVDREGFWVRHFQDVVGTISAGKRAFLAPEADGDKTRALLRLAQVTMLDHEHLVDCVERAGPGKPATWWYECYAQIAGDGQLARQGSSFYVGRKLIPSGVDDVLAVPGEGGMVACIPPVKEGRRYRVPYCFRGMLAFLDPGLARRLAEGDGSVRNWAETRLRLAKFEASDLIPRLVHGVGPLIFTGGQRINTQELSDAWRFIKRMLDGAGTRLIGQLAEGVGCFPIPIGPEQPGGSYDPGSLAPAFLAYWPDAFLDSTSPLLGVPGLRRIDESFLRVLLARGEATLKGWRRLLTDVGVSAAPKRLHYSWRSGDASIPFQAGAPSLFTGTGFTGERRVDENRAVLTVLRDEPLWDKLVSDTYACRHSLTRWPHQTATRSLDALTVLEGFSSCVEMAKREHEHNDDNWRQSLWQLVRGLPLNAPAERDQDKVRCPGGYVPNGTVLYLAHIVNPRASYVQHQLSHYRWLPASSGPLSIGQCFARLATRRIIQTGAPREDLNDMLLPYVVAERSTDLDRLRQCGVEALDDLSSASPNALERALRLLGERLATPWGRKEILQMRGRWFLVRDAIQGMYRALDRRNPPSVGGFKIAIRRSDGVHFVDMPWGRLYYADPGSPAEHAFRDVLMLVDADRPHTNLFRLLYVHSLVPGKTITEALDEKTMASPAPRLRQEIVGGLGSYLLAPILRNVEQVERDLIVRRLREHFAVRVADCLRVVFALNDDPSKQGSVDFPDFYLRRPPAQAKENDDGYVLYVVSSSANVSLTDLDADALGQVIAPLFLDGLVERPGDRWVKDLAAYFPRITAHYQHQRIRGLPDVEGTLQMEDFTHRRLGISRDVHDLARTLLGAQAPPAAPPELRPPPPAVVVAKPGAVQPTTGGTPPAVIPTGPGTAAPPTPRPAPTLVIPHVTGDVGIGRMPHGAVVTPEKQERGLRGEEEIMRRLKRSGGWEGFTFLADMRNPGVGHDFLCSKEGHDVKLEVKTFTEDGRLLFTDRELTEAATSGPDYVLVGVLDDGGPEAEWRTFLLADPLSELQSKGEVEYERKLSVTAIGLFGSHF